MHDVGQLFLHAQQEVVQKTVKGLRFLRHGEVTTAFQDLQPGVRESGTEGFAVSHRDDTIALKHLSAFPQAPSSG